MNTKIFNNSRFRPKGDIEANWNKAVGFIPLDKEIIIYKPDEKHKVARIKVGDGVTSVQDLPFVTDMDDLASKEWVTEAFETAGISIQQYIDKSVTGLASEEYVDNTVHGLATEEYVDNAVAAIPQADWNQNDETARDYIKNRPFGEQSFEITWDGVVGDRDVINISGDGDLIIAKISDKIFSYEDYLGATVSITTPNGVENISITEEDMDSKEELEAAGIYTSSVVEGVVSVFDLNKAESVVGTRFPSTGTYFMKSSQNNIYVSSFSNSKVTKLDEKYIPDTIARVKDLDSVIQTATKDNILSIFN